MSKYKETSGYIIHSRDFKNSSLILEFFSQEHGIFHLIAKGAKKNKRLKSQLQYFCLLKIQYFGKSSLKTLTTANIIHNQELNSLKSKTSGLYLNELLHLSLNENEVAKQLFTSYENSLKQLNNSNITKIFRNFECLILQQCGFELDVSNFNHNDWLCVDENYGLCLAKTNANKVIQTHEVEKFLAGQPLDRTSQKKLNRLMYQLINLCVAHREIHCRKMLIELYNNS